jgi:hypothetical protein
MATLAVLALVLATMLGQGAYLITYVQGQRQVQECYQTQFDDLIESSAAFRTAGQQDRQAQRELLLGQSGSEALQDAAIERYLQQLDEADRTRLSSPLPERRCR